MRNSPIDLVNKRFPGALRGYTRAAVDDYLREVSADYEEVVSENARLRETVETLQRELSAFRAVEATLKDALVLAQKAADDTRSAARREAEAVLRDARAGATEVVARAERQAEAAHVQRERFVSELRVLLRTHMEQVEALPREPAAPPPTPAPSTREPASSTDAELSPGHVGG